MNEKREGEINIAVRPFTEGSFQEKIDEFVAMIRGMSMQDIEATPEERRQMISGSLRFDEFCSAIRTLFGEDVRSHDLKSVYRKLTTNPDAKIDWTEIFGYLQNEKEEQEQTLNEDITVFTIGKKVTMGDAAGDKRRRDIVQCLSIASSIDCYLSISQKKCVTVWSSKLKLQSCTELNEQSWATAIEYMPSIRRIAASTERSINFLDHRAKGKNQQIFSVKPLTQSPLTICRVPFGRNSQEDALLFGDDQGYINFMTITQKDLTPRQVKGDKRMLQSFEIEPNSLTMPIKRRKFHDDWVMRVKYFPELKCFGSCSPCQQSSLVLEPVERIWDNGEFKEAIISKGVNAFDYCARANVVVTGGVDKIVRVWHPHIWARPTGKLIGHLFTISDVVCNEKDQHVISLSTARVFRVWDIHTLSCLQIFTDSDERPGERRIYAIAYDNRHDRLLSGSSVIEAWPLTRAVQDTMQVPHTHDRPIVQVLLNRELNQLVSVCTESLIKVWEVESGSLVYQISEPHGAGIEVTSMAVDVSGYRLATGAYNGSVNVWDFGSGQEVKSYRGVDTDDDLSIIGMVYTEVTGYRCIVASGWCNQIKILLDSNEGRDLLYLRSFTDDFCYSIPETTSLLDDTQNAGSINPYMVLPEIGEPKSITSPVGASELVTKRNHDENMRRERLLQTHEITVQDTLIPDILITGCVNGNLLIWDLSQALVDKLVTLPQTETTETAISHSPKVVDPFRVNVVRVLVHHKRKLDPDYARYLSRKDVIKDEDSEVGNTKENKENDTVKTSLSKRNSRASVMSKQIEIKEQRRAPTQSALINDEDRPYSADAIDYLKSEVDEQTAPDLLETVSSGEDDPNNHMIVESFPPVIVSAHGDGRIRFWDLEGELLCSLAPEYRHPGTSLTAVGVDMDANVLVVGDKKGYLTQFDVGKFLEKPQVDPATGFFANPVAQVVSWRAHLSKIVCVEHLPTSRIFVSASVDGSARLWWGRFGRFVGFFGQVRPFSIPREEEDEESIATLPYDITERPVITQQRSQSAKQKARATRNMEYPLKFIESRWDPFSRTRFLKERSEEKGLDQIQLYKPFGRSHQPLGGIRISQYQKDILEKPLEKKFFKAVIKPKAYNHHLESYCSGERREGAVFRALPVYRVGTPSDVKPPSGLLYVDLDRTAEIRRNKRMLKKISTMKNSHDGRETQLSKYGQSSDGSRRSSIIGSLPKTVR